MLNTDLLCWRGQSRKWAVPKIHVWSKGISISYFSNIYVYSSLSILRKCRTFETSERYINYTRRVESSYVDFVSMYVKTELEAQFLVVVVLARIARIARICTTWNYRVQVHLSFRALCFRCSCFEYLSSAVYVITTRHCKASAQPTCLSMVSLLQYV